MIYRPTLLLDISIDINQGDVGRRRIITIVNSKIQTNIIVKIRTDFLLTGDIILYIDL